MLTEKQVARAEQENHITKLERFISDTSERYQAEGLPIANDGRIDMRGYREVYPLLERDLTRVRALEKGWYGDVTEEEVRAKRRENDGERLEMLAFAIFSKNFGDRYVVARSSWHDDFTNKVDTILLDRETGNLVCAFDEVGSVSGVEYEDKLNKVRELNVAGGASIKYGLGVTSAGGKKKIVPEASQNIPLFHLALPKDRMEKGITEFVSDPVRQSEYEERLFAYFISSLAMQIAGLELYQKRLPPKLKDRLNAFKTTVEQLKAREPKPGALVKKQGTGR